VTDVLRIGQPQEDIELTGPAELKPTVFVGGIKRLPVVCRF
jgi:hypothetical protein